MSKLFERLSSGQNEEIVGTIHLTQSKAEGNNDSDNVVLWPVPWATTRQMIGMDHKLDKVIVGQQILVRLVPIFLLKICPFAKDGGC